MSETLQAKDQSNTPRCEVTHSPLPWKFGRNANKAACIWTQKPAQNIIAKLYHIPHETGSATANAAYIVKACNEYPKLLAALKPFALAADELRVITPISASDTFVWKPSSNTRETNGITAQHLLDAKAVIANAEKSNG